MNKGDSTQVVSFFRYMRLFRVTCFSVLRVESECIHAIVAWSEDCSNGIPGSEDVQEVRWNYTSSETVDDALVIGEYAFDKGWITSDKLKLDEGEIQRSLCWDKERVYKALKELMMLRVQMIDDEREVDAFFLHG
ncbi:MAG: hypothetical protein PHO37_18390 [Kiritimatiellae bacterium]|nr:hypothetical protein [Kiritimatiellia bacterium]